MTFYFSLKTIPPEKHVYLSVKYSLELETFNEIIKKKKERLKLELLQVFSYGKCFFFHLKMSPNIFLNNKTFRNKHY